MDLSDAYGGMWENPQEKGTMAGFAGGFGGGAEASGTEAVTGYWEQVPYQTGYGAAYFDANGELVVSEPKEWTNGTGWIFRADNGNIGGGGIGTSISAQRFSLPPQAYMSPLPPYKMHWGRFFELNALCYPNTLAVTSTVAVGVGGTVWFFGGATPASAAAGVYATFVYGAPAGLLVVEIEYLSLSIYREGWPAPPEPGAPPPGLGQLNQQKFALPPPPGK